MGKSSGRLTRECSKWNVSLVAWIASTTCLSIQIGLMVSCASSAAKFNLPQTIFFPFCIIAWSLPICDSASEVVKTPQQLAVCFSASTFMLRTSRDHALIAEKIKTQYAKNAFIQDRINESLFVRQLMKGRIVLWGNLSWLRIKPSWLKYTYSGCEQCNSLACIACFAIVKTSVICVVSDVRGIQTSTDKHGWSASVSATGRIRSENWHNYRNMKERCNKL